MLTPALVTLVAFLITLAITPICRSACNRLGWVDEPGTRKLHRTPVPRTGGIAIFLGYGISLGLLLMLPHGAYLPQQWGFSSPWAVAAAVVVVFGTGLLDDLFGLKPWMKILGQVIAAALACHGGVQIVTIGGVSIAQAWWSTPVTALWLVGCANAFNLIDGLDGLAAGLGFLAAATAFLAAVLSGNLVLALVTAPLIGALLGFLPYNFNPASIFMGDCGSLTIGFLLGCFGVIGTQKSATLLGMTAPLIALAVPLLDTTLAIARRFLRHQPIFAADRAHIHHRLLERGLTTRRVIYVLYASAGLVAALSLLLSATEKHLGGVIVVAFCVLVWFAIRYLGYEEFDAARRIIFGGVTFWRAMDADLSIRNLEHAVHAARTLDECWKAVLDTSRSFGFSEASLQTPTRRFSAHLTAVDQAECWNLHIPLNGSGQLDLSMPFNPALPPSRIAPFATSVRSVLTSKIHEFLAHPETESDLPEVAGRQDKYGDSENHRDRSFETPVQL